MSSFNCLFICLPYLYLIERFGYALIQDLHGIVSCLNPFLTQTSENKSGLKKRIGCQDNFY